MYQQLENNRIDNVDLKSRLREQIAQPLRQLAQGPMPRLESQLGEANERIEDPQAGAAALADATRTADSVLVEMQQILDRMLELESYNEVIGLLRGILDDQQSLQRSHQKAADRTNQGIVRGLTPRMDRTMKPAQKILALVAILCFTPRSGLRAAEPSSTPPPPGASDELSVEQARIADRFARLETVLARLAELSATHRSAASQGAPRSHRIEPRTTTRSTVRDDCRAARKRSDSRQRPAARRNCRKSLTTC